MDSTSLVNVVSQGRSAENQTDSWVYNTETVTFPHHSLTESSSKCVNHNNLMLISSVSGEMSQQAASFKLLPNYQNNELKMSKRNHPTWFSNDILLMRQRDNIFHFIEHQKFIRIQLEFIMRIHSLTRLLIHFEITGVKRQNISLSLTPPTFTELKWSVTLKSQVNILKYISSLFRLFVWIWQMF